MRNPVPTNHYKGEFGLKIKGVDYKMAFDLAIYAEFKSETDRDPFAMFADLINQVNQMSAEGVYNKPPDLANTEIMARLTTCVTPFEAAWLFYLSAHKSNKAVTFEEMQDAVWIEGFSMGKEIVINDDGDTDFATTYPNLMVEFAMFALGIGAAEKGGNEPPKKLTFGLLSLERLKSYLLTRIST